MKYPEGVKKNYVHTNISHRNRGMTLEADLNVTNDYYLKQKKANIHKKPTPIKLVKVEYNIIKEAYFKEPSTTDYNGIYKGKYLDFEAKETINKTYFPLNNIHAHQIEHLRSIMEMGGIGFLIIRFTTLNETYLLKGESLLLFLSTKKTNMPYNYIKENGYLISDKYIPRVDYLQVIDQIMEEKNEKKN